MKVRHISYRVEFQGRGAGHIHGVLWLDMKEMRIKGVPSETLRSAFEKLRFSQALEEDEVAAVEGFTDTFVTCTRCVSVAGEDAVRKAEEVNWHGHSSSCHKSGPPGQCRWKFPKFPLARTIFVDANREVHEEEHKMEKEEREDILNRVMGVLVETEGNRMVLSKKVEEIMTSDTFKNVKKVESRRKLPRENSNQQPEENSKQSKEDPKQSPAEDREEAPKDKFSRWENKITYVKMETPEEYEENIRKRIEKVLKIASAGGEPITYYRYEMAVRQQPRKGSEVLLRRDIDEVFMSNYNPEWMEVWDANHDLSPVYDYYGVITYVTDYFTKDSTGLTDVLKAGMKQLGRDGDMRQKCNSLADLFMSHRQVGEAEAYYKLLANMNLVYSNVATVYAPTEPKRERRQFLQRQDPEGGKGFKVKDKEGLFLEKPDLVSKYERRKLLGPEEDTMDDDILDGLCYCQWVKMFEGRGWHGNNTNEEGEYEEPVEDANPAEGELADGDGFNFVVTGEEGKNRRRKLPQALTLHDPLPGEPVILHKRSFPRALRFFKKRFNVNPHRYYLAELMLYHPFRDESELFPDDEEKCEQLYLENEHKIKRVKAQLMPFLESVDEAQQIYQEKREKEERDIEEVMGADLDPEMEQEVADGEEEEEEDHPDYYHIDTIQVQDDPSGGAGPRQVFKAIVLPDKHEQVNLCTIQQCLSNVSKPLE